MVHIRNTFLFSIHNQLISLAVVIVQLRGYSAHADALGAAAREALGSIKLAITEHQRVKIITAKNRDVTGQSILRPQAPFGQRAIVEESSDENEGQDSQDPGDIIVGVAKEQSKESAGGEKVAVVLTDDKSVRLKAATRGVAAIAASVFKKARGGIRTLASRAPLEA